MSKLRLLVIGCGKMGSAILDGIIRKHMIENDSLFIVEPNIDQKIYLEKKGLTVFKRFSELNLSKLKINSILLAVKPQIVKEVVTDLKKIMTSNIFIITNIGSDFYFFYSKTFRVG